MASLWVWTPGDEDPDVQAMPAKVEASRNDVDRIIVTVRGKDGRRYESEDSAWLEFTDAEATRLIERVAAALSSPLDMG